MTRYDRLTGWDKDNAYIRECFERTPEQGGCEHIGTSRCEWCEASLEIVRRLAAYEDSGLSPEQVAEFVHKGLPAALDKLAEYESTGLSPEQVMALVEEDKPLFDTNTCRVCGCTDDMACPGGCWWVEPDLCSRCAEKDASFGGCDSASIEKKGGITRGKTDVFARGHDIPEPTQPAQKL